MVSDSSTARLHIANYLRLASGDLRDARTLRASGGRNAAYLAQQAAEKLLLALLTSEGIERARSESHLLDVLAGKLPESNPLREDLAKIGFLSVFATTYRYPKQGGRLPVQPDWHRVDKALATLESILNRTVQHFGVDVGADDRLPASKGSPIR
jgi:HEPN domain-containing protein